MTKQELIEENNRLKAGLKEIYGYTSAEPLEESSTEKMYYKYDDLTGMYTHRLGYIAGTIEYILDPDYFEHTRDERKAVIESIQTP